MTQPTPRSSWRLCAGLGLALALLGPVVLGQFPTDAATDLGGYGAPVYAFEMAGSVEDLEAVFGSPLDPARPARLAAMDAGNRWDYPFMLLYGAFIASFFAAAARGTGRRRWLGAAALGVIAACADGVENLVLLGLTKDLEAAPHLALLPYPVWTKFFALMGAGSAAGAFLLRQAGTGWRVAGGIAVLGALAVVPGFVAPGQVGWVVGNGIGAAWIAQLAWALARSR